MPAPTSAGAGMRDLLLVVAIGLLASGLTTVAARFSDMSRTFVAVPATFAAHAGGSAGREPVAPSASECPCGRFEVRAADAVAYTAPAGPSAAGVAAVQPIMSPRERFLGETAVMRERARTSRQNDPRRYLQLTSEAIRLRGVGIVLAGDIPPLAGDK